MLVLLDTELYYRIDEKCLCILVFAKFYWFESIWVQRLGDSIWGSLTFLGISYGLLLTHALLFLVNIMLYVWI